MNYHNSWTYLLGAGLHRLHLRDELVVVLLVPAEAPKGRRLEVSRGVWQDEQAHYCKSQVKRRAPRRLEATAARLVSAQKRPEEWQDEQAHCKSPEEKAHPSSMYLSWYWAGWPSAARFLPIGVDSLPQQYLRSAAVTSVRQASCQQHSQQPIQPQEQIGLRQASFQ